VDQDMKRCPLDGNARRWSRTHSSAKILSMKRSSRVSFVSQCKTSLSECTATGSMFGGAFISFSRAVTWIDGTGYVVSPLGDVNGRPPQIARDQG